MISLQGGHYIILGPALQPILNGLPFCFLGDYKLDYKTVKLYRKKGIDLYLNIKLFLTFNLLHINGGGGGKGKKSIVIYHNFKRFKDIYNNFLLNK